MGAIAVDWGKVEASDLDPEAVDMAIEALVENPKAIGPESAVFETIVRLTELDALTIKHNTQEDSEWLS